MTPAAAATAVVAVDARCPLCGESILSIGLGGQVLSSDLHPIRLNTRGREGEGYMLCDDCGTLAELPPPIVLN